MKRLKVGLLGLVHNNFTGDKDAVFTKASKGLKELAATLDFDLHLVEKGIANEKDAVLAYKELKEANIDYLLVLNVQFASGKIISMLADLTENIGLWSVPETSKSGPLPLNSFCGMNMNASILSEYLGKTKYKWFYGYSEDELFKERFRITIKALQAIKNIKGSNMALIGGIADGFDNQYYDERKIYDRFQVRVSRNLEFSDLKNRSLSYSNEDLKDIKSYIKQSSCFENSFASKVIDNTARVVKALIDIKEEMDLAGIALGCWPKFRMEMDMVACAAIGYLNQLGIVTACEGDVYGLLSMFLLKQLSQQPTLLMDLVEFDENDQSLQFWHCGVGCKSLAHQEEVKLATHFNPALVPGKGVINHGPVAEMIFKEGKATVARITKEGNSLFLLDGEFFAPDKPSFDGSRAWFKDLSLSYKSIQVRDLINTIIVKGMQHHYAVALGNHAQEMMEIAAYLEIKPLKKVEYQDFIQLG